MKTTIFVAIILIFSFQVSAFTYCNDLECIFSENPEKSLLSENVVNGAAYFLKAKSYGDLFLYEYEKSALQSFNYSLSASHSEKAILELEAAKARYGEAIKIGKRIGYNEKKIDWFKSHNYDTFTANNNLNTVIAQRVRNYLSAADVLGVYQQCIDDIDDILNILYILREETKSGRKPDITLVWRLFQQFSEASLFGNYATVMGTAILGHCDD